MEEKKYRHELKHAISLADMLAIRARMRAVATPDPHARDGKYYIRSLYFDNASDKALREKIDGVNSREKFRIRFYNFDPSLIHLEKKSKLNGLGTKYSAKLTAAEVQSLIDYCNCSDGSIDWMAEAEERPLVQELYLKMRYQGLRPKTLVDYTREPFIFAPGNVRVTLDYDLRTGLRSTDFLNPNAITIPAGESPIILEVKWDAYLPDIIRDAVETPSTRVQAFSKYAECRIYG